MDPRLMKLFGITYQAPVGDPDGEDGADHHDDDDREDADGDDSDEPEDGEDDDPDDADDADDDDEDEGDDDPDEDGDEDGDGEDDEQDDEELGGRAKKRIFKLIAQRKDAEARVTALQAQLDEARKLTGDDGKAIIRAAEASGILPGLMSKDEAKAFDALEKYPRVIDIYRDWLDEHGTEDEYGEGDDAMTYGQVRKRVRHLEAELREIQDEYGDSRKELKKKVREIFEAGIKALKAGTEARQPRRAGAEARQPKNGQPEIERKKKKLETKPTGHAAPKHKRTTRAEDMEVDNGDDLESFILADMRGKKKK